MTEMQQKMRELRSLHSDFGDSGWGDEKSMSELLPKIGTDEKILSDVIESNGDKGL